MASTYTESQIIDLAYGAGLLLQRNGIAFSWTELKMTVELLSTAEPALDPLMIAEFYACRA
jgi:hypothetical protein